MQQTLNRAGFHRGSSFVEVLQNCNIFNDGAWRDFTDREVREDRMIFLEDGKPMVFGKDRDRGLRLNGHQPEVVQLGGEYNLDDILVHDESDPFIAFMLSRLSWPDFPVPVGVVRNVRRPTHDEMLTEQLDQALASKGPGNLQDLLNGSDTWVVD
jgi:2-oxoglutarate ferredoxin oxidoreductase subunit beta